MRDGKHLSELELLSLVDAELSAAEAAGARAHLTRCFSCTRLYEGLRRESDVLRAAVAAEPARRPEIRQELGWAVAAGLLVSLGLVAFRRLFLGIGEAAAETPLPDALPLLSNLGYRFLSLLDYQQIGAQMAYGGILAMTVLAIALASAAIRRTRARAMPLLLAAALVPTLGARAEALEFLSGSASDCRVAAEQVVEDDLLLMCDTAEIAGAVRGDVYFLGRSLTVSGRVEGDLIGVGNEILVDGGVGLSLRGGAQTIRISGELGRGMTAAGERISVDSGGRVGGGVIVAGRHLTFAGPVGRSVLAFSRLLELDAPVGGDFRSYGEKLRFGSGADVTGSATFHGPSEPEREPGASEVEWIEPEPEETDSWGAALDVLIGWGMGLVLGLALVLLASGPLGAISAIGARPLAPMLVGLPLFVGIPFAAILLAVTFVGLPLAITTAALYAFLLYAARIAAAMVIGQAILGLASTAWQRIGRVALGLGILALAVEIPVAGTVVSLLIMFFGLGTFALWIWRSRPSAALT